MNPVFVGLALPYITSALAEYGVNAPQFGVSFAYPKGSKKIKDARLSPATLDDSEIAKGLSELIGTDPKLAPGPDVLYLIVAPQDATRTTQGVSGSHNFFYQLAPAGQKAPIYYAWAVQSQPETGQTPIDALTVTLSHELLDACTGPQPPLGYVFQGQGRHGKVDGIDVTSYFSHDDVVTVGLATTDRTQPDELRLVFRGAVKTPPGPVAVAGPPTISAPVSGAPAKP